MLDGIRRARSRLGAASAAVLVVAAAVVAHVEIAAAHEIPADVTVVAFAKPDGARLRVLVRVPLVSIRDVEFPLRGPGYLDLDALAPLLPGAATIWIADYARLYEDGRPLDAAEVVATRISLPSDRSFMAWASALDHVSGPPLAPATDLAWENALLDVLLEVPIASEQSRFAIAPAWSHLGIRTVTVLRYVAPDGAERLFRYEGDPGVVRLDPRWHQAALLFVESGFFHILEGLDHLLFLLCLVIPFRRFGGLVPIVTAFTVAHSITLIASASGLAPDVLWFPPLIETLIAASIVYMAFENIVGASSRTSDSTVGSAMKGSAVASAGGGGTSPGGQGMSSRLRRRWVIAFGFGLVHGFGFSFLLRDSLQFAGSHLALSLVSFNVGVELGQLAVLLVLVPALVWLFRRVVTERIGTILLSALVAHTAWHWMTSRGSALLEYEFRWPTFDALLLASVMRWLMLALIVLGVVWLLSALFGAWSKRGASAGRVVDAGELS